MPSRGAFPSVDPGKLPQKMDSRLNRVFHTCRVGLRENWAMTEIGVTVASDFLCLLALGFEIRR